MKCGFIVLLAAWIILSGEVLAVAQPVPATESAEDGSEQEGDEIETDRDSFTPATTITEPGRAILEAAHTFIDNRTVPETHSYPELLIRYGTADWLELRLGWNYEIGGAGSPVSGNVPDDFGEEGALEEEHRLLYGLKAGVTDQCGWLPDSAIILQGFTPTGGEGSRTDMSASYVFGWMLPNEWVWDSALRYSTASLEGDGFNVWAPSSVLKFPLGERWKGHVEYFGTFSDKREDETVQHFFSPGAHYLITRDLEVGVRVGWGLNEEAPNFFSNAGLGWRY